MKYLHCKNYNCTDFSSKYRMHCMAIIQMIIAYEIFHYPLPDKAFIKRASILSKLVHTS